jgi:hypothetical protein
MRQGCRRPCMALCDPASGPSVAAPGSGKKRARRTVALTSHGLGVRPLLLQLPGARTPESSAHGNSAPTPGRALFILGLATAPPTAAKSRSSRSASARGVTKPQGKAPPLRGGLARRRPPMPTRPRRRGSWGTKPPTRTSRDLKGLFHQSNSESGGDERRKKLYVMYGGSSELVSRQDVRTLG